jgi:hypothetical protein
LDVSQRYAAVCLVGYHAFHVTPPDGQDVGSNWLSAALNVAARAQRRLPAVAHAHVGAARCAELHVITSFGLHTGIQGSTDMVLALHQS